MIQASGYASPYYAFKGAAIAKRDFQEHFAIDLLVKDQTLMLEQGAAHGVPMPGLAAIREVFQAARAQGHGREDICAVIQALGEGRRPVGPRALFGNGHSARPRGRLGRSETSACAAALTSE